MNIDYDLHVINPENQDSTPEQIRDCIYDALYVLNERTELKPPRAWLKQFEEKRKRAERSE